MLVAGGCFDGFFRGIVLESAEVYNPASALWTPAGRMTQPRAGSRAILLQDGRVLLTGGASTASAELYDETTGTFTPPAHLPKLAVVLPPRFCPPARY